MSKALKSLFYAAIILMSKALKPILNVLKHKTIVKMG
jgi:hypothetical protein